MPVPSTTVVGSRLTPAQEAAAGFISSGTPDAPPTEILPEGITARTDTKRDSAVTAAKYNKWIVSELNRVVVKDVQRQREELRQLKARLKEEQRQWAVRHHRDPSRRHEQSAAGKSAMESIEQQNMEKAMQVRAEIEARRAKQQAERAAWLEHGRRLAYQDKLQRTRNKEVVGANTKRVAELSAMARQEALDLERHLLSIRNDINKHNREKTQRIKATANQEIVDTSKNWSNANRRKQAQNVESELKDWKTERESHMMAHIAKAKANKAAAETSRKKAKELRAQLEAKRRAEASISRDRQRRNAAEKEKMVSSSIGGVRDSHDTLYRRRYVPADRAEALQNSPYANKILA